ncbi:MAG: tetratricopeptide repeat protein [Oscillatoriales cyanobacterium SM2_2_1]|nr:tetratricopeptide repeat protein [Oscillatoriales cyanobacterium SM2_2_1]
MEEIRVHAEVLIDEQRWSEAITLLQTALRQKYLELEHHADPQILLDGSHPLPQEILALEQVLAQCHSRQGHHFWQQQDLIAAAQAYRSAVELDPHNPEFLLHMGGIAQSLGDFAEATAAYEAALALKPDYAEAYANIGSVKALLYDYDGAIAAYEHAYTLNPQLIGLDENLNRIYLRCVPRWHFPMMNDEKRNHAYDQALRKAIRPDSHVLDIGSGSGLLAMMAARAGAALTTTCEKVLPVARMAEKIIAANGLGDRIRVHAKVSHELHIGTDLPRRANILVSEIFDVGLLAEHAIPAIQHARSHLLTEDAQILPCAATVYGALLESEALYYEDRVSTAAGFDVSLFNTFSSRYTYLQHHLRHFPHRLLSAPVPVFEFDFTQTIPPAQKELHIPIHTTGTCHGLVFWFRLWLDAEIHIDTSPLLPDTCWMQAIQLWRSPPMSQSESPHTVTANQVIPILATHNTTYITFHWQ